MSRPRKPRPIADSIRAVRERTAPATLLAAVQTIWPDAVGPRIADAAWPVRERDGVIAVACRASTWAQELSLLEPELRERLNAVLDGPEVERLRFSVGPEPGVDTL